MKALPLPAKACLGREKAGVLTQRRPCFGPCHKKRPCRINLPCIEQRDYHSLRHQASFVARDRSSSSLQSVGFTVAFLAAGLLFLPGGLCSAEARTTLSEAGDTLVGIPRVVDGDTLVVENEKIRLYGVDAPETKQTCTDSKGQPYSCGETAANALKQRIGSSSIACQVKTKDLYQRNVSSCNLPGTGDIGDWLVKNGYAVAYREYSKDYVQDEEIAKKDHKGIWQGGFQIPGQWRRENKQKGRSSKDAVAKGPLATLPQKLKDREEAGPPSGCNIKGNISAQGTRIFHVPGGRYYDSVKIELAKGEKFFCSEADAEKDGFRKSKE